MSRIVIGQTFALDDLREILVRELTLADTSFRDSQRMAHRAMVRDLVASEEFIAIHPLEIAEVTLDFALCRAKPGWLARVRQWAANLFRTSAPWPAHTHYRFAPGKGDIQIQCRLKRSATGGYRADCEEKKPC